MNSEKNSKNNKRGKRPFYNFWYDFVKVTGALPALVWLRPKIYRPYGTKTPKGALLISANHSSFIDPIKLLVAFPTRRMHSIATKDLYNTRLKRMLFNAMHCIMVDKSNFTVSSFHEIVSRLQEGCAVMIFPEGEVNQSKDNTLLAFKSGVVLMAHRANAPIMPVYIPRREKWYHRQHIIIGDLFYVAGEAGKMPTLEQLNNASDTLREKELELREYFESLPVYKKLNRKNTEQSESTSKENTKDEQKV